VPSGDPSSTISARQSGPFASTAGTISSIFGRSLYVGITTMQFIASPG